MNNLDLYTIEMITNETQLNDHTGALIRLARALDEQFLVDQLFILDGRHATAGEMTQKLREERRTYYSWLMGKAQEVFDNFTEIQAAF
jgi:hypothetical protein